MNDKTPIGMGGWLLLFSLSMTVRPLLAMVGVLGGLVLFATVPEDRLFMGSYIGLSVPMVGYCCYAAFLLWSKEASAPWVTRRYLWVFLAYGVLLSLLSIGVRPKTQQVEALVRGLIFQGAGSVVYSLIWLRYLKVSVRVRNTYSQTA